jgi:hypothetical protein
VKVYANGIEWWVAHDMAHLAELYVAHTGLDLGDDDAIGDGWSEVPAEKVIGIVIDDHGDISDSGAALKLTAAEWAEREGPGLLCSSEY